MDLSTAMSFTDAAPQLTEALSHVNITEHDPAIILNWDLNALQAFVARAATIAVAGPPLLQTVPPTIASLTEDIVAFLRQVAGGRFGVVVLAPNDMEQYGNVINRLRDVEIDPFMQACFAAAPPDQRLARTAFLLDNHRELRPMNQRRVPPPPPSRQIFTWFTVFFVKQKICCSSDRSFEKS